MKSPRRERKGVGAVNFIILSPGSKAVERLCEEYTSGCECMKHVQLGFLLQNHGGKDCAVLENFERVSLGGVQFEIN